MILLLLVLLFDWSNLIQDTLAYGAFVAMLMAAILECELQQRLRIEGRAS